MKVQENSWLCLLLASLTCALASRKVSLGQEVTLDCPVASKPDFLEAYWSLPGGLSVFENFDSLKFEYHSSTGSLTVKKVSPSDAGTYVCKARFYSSQPQSALVDLLVGQRWDLWEQGHKDNLIHGLIAAAITFSITVLACMLYKFRWKASKISFKAQEHMSTISLTSNSQPHTRFQGTDNVALEMTDDDVSITLGKVQLPSSNSVEMVLEDTIEVDKSVPEDNDVDVIHHSNVEVKVNNVETDKETPI